MPLFAVFSYTATPEGEVVRQFSPWITDSAGVELRLDNPDAPIVRRDLATSEAASIACRLINDDERWLLYTSPVTIVSGAEITAQAIRYGWKPSEPTSLMTPDE